MSLCHGFDCSARGKILFRLSVVVVTAAVAPTATATEAESLAEEALSFETASDTLASSVSASDSTASTMFCAPLASSGNPKSFSPPSFAHAEEPRHLSQQEPTRRIKLIFPLHHYHRSHQTTTIQHRRIANVTVFKPPAKCM